MTLSLWRPATMFDLAACAPATTLQMWAMAQVQVKLGPSWALRTGEAQTVICGGFVPWVTDPALGQAWFVASPLAKAHMVSAVRACREAMAHVLTGNQASYVRLMVFVSTPEGRRIAMACGYRFHELRSDGMEVFST